MALTQHASVGDALVRLMRPLVEVVIHELKSDRIVYKNGSLSLRKVGDASLLDADGLSDDDSEVIYPKRGFDGRLIKSISIKLEKKWLMCINVDISIFSEMSKLSERMLAFTTHEKPKALFHKDWQERLHHALHDFLQDQGWRFSTLTLRQKKAVIKHLYELGAFSEKNAADYIARTLSIGRATVFNYLREWR